jgi:hypothetical protein
MAIPEKRADLESFGYSKLSDSHCSGCGAPIEWWETPRKRKMPFTVRADGTLVTHFFDCPKRKDFQRPRPR